MNILEEFVTWFTLGEVRYKSDQCKVEIVWSPDTGDKRSVRADIDTNHIVARVIAWESGECEKLALEMASGEQIIEEYTLCETPSELHAFLDTFMKDISC